MLLNVDRSHGRVIEACMELFVIYNATFIENPRYVALDLVPSTEDAKTVSQTVRDSFKGAVTGFEQWIGRKHTCRGERPSCYWTIKQ